MKYPLSLVPTAPVLAGLVTGILLSQAGVHVYVVALLVAASVAMYLSRWHYAAFVVLSCALGWCVYLLHEPEMPPLDVMGREGRYVAEVSRVREYSGGRVMVVEVRRLEGYGAVEPFLALMPTATLEPLVAVGDVVCFDGAPTDIERYDDLPGQTDYSAYYKAMGVTAQMEHDVSSLKVYPVDDPGWRNVMERQRMGWVNCLYSSGMRPETVQLIAAMVIGDTSTLENETRRAFSSAGLAHVLALSGLHVGVIAFMISLVLFPLTVFGLNNCKWTVTIVLLWIYACVTGFSPSVTRAVVMATVFLGARILQRRYSPYNSLSVAAIIILVFDPRALFQPGFQMSFMAVLSILMFSGRLNPFANSKNRLAYNAMMLVTVPVSAMLGTGMIAAAWFGNYPVYFLVANLATVWIVPLFVGSGMLMCGCLSVGLCPGWLCGALDFMSGLFSGIADWVSGLPLAGVCVGVAAIALAAYFLSVGCAYVSLVRKSKVWWMITLFSASVFVVMLFCGGRHPSAGVYVSGTRTRTDIVADTGQGFVYVHTTSETADRETMCRAYDGFFRNIRADSICFAGNEAVDSGCFLRQGHIFAFGDRVMVMVTDKKCLEKPAGLCIDYAIVDRRYVGRLGKVIEELRPDTVVIARDVSLKRRGAWIDTCMARGVPVIDLRKRGLKVVTSGV